MHFLKFLIFISFADFVKLCNPEWNENVTEEEGFIHALKLADEFWNIYIKHAIAEVEAIEIIINKIEETNENGKR